MHISLAILLFSLLLFASSSSQQEEDNELNVRRIMKDMAIIPDILKEPPKQLLKMMFENSLDIAEGKAYTPTELKFQPKLEWDADAETFYTIIMVSPDAPSRENPMYRSWLHWLVVNVPGKDVMRGQTISEYYGPLPPKESGLLRYVCLVYQQSDKLDFEEKRIELNNAEGHSNFDVEKFIDKYDMEQVPVAGNIFEAKWDEFVPELMKTLYNVSE
ncbi:uncharacterized protein Dwil_GK26794 [Drosophila willistoni]|uniref:Odorant-binding protein A5 n=1 Tax=Drosophila willistoni TaxID=7260 RepID=A0A0Q9WRV7_DROWI|nr:putative odorant-binding protein A5 [Drosophila willistoni]KRF98333.1 uncharacterized protein Dwil_GK26794 [Drosophila willistoni]